jgi:hypothetical protein
MQAPLIKLATHGLLVITIGLVAGLVFTAKITGGLPMAPLGPDLRFDVPGTVAAWRGAHTGNLLNGIFVIAVVSLLRSLPVSHAQAERLFTSGAATLWGNCIFYLGAIGSPNRALSIGDNAAGAATIFGIIGFAGAFIAIVGVFVFLFTARKILADSLRGVET